MLPRTIHAATMATLGAWIPPGSDAAIVDVPVHRNIGDLFILATALRLLQDLHCRIVYRAGVRDYRSHSARRRIGPGTIIIGLGGGNFGDVYPRYQSLRERIVEDFPENRIVILPQTIHFTMAQGRERARERFAAHPDVRIAVRDRVSLEVAQAFTSAAALLPDIVHALGECGAARPRTGGARRTVFLMRRDREQGRSRERPVRSLDWSAVFPEFLPRLALAATLMPLAYGTYGPRLHDEWGRYAGDLLSRGLSWMADVDHLVTDRLHAAVLARLAGRPVTLRDNAYGKLTAYYDAWWRQDPDVTLEESPNAGDET